MVRKGLLLSIPLFAVIAALGLAGWMMTPEGQAIAVHWNMAGEADRTAGPIEAFLAISGIALVLIAIFAIAPAIDPRGRNLQRSKPLWLAAWIGSLFILALVQGIITLSAVGLVEMNGSTMPRLIGSVVAIFIMIIGNALGKARPNWFAGIRTPWSLSSDRSWDITHRWGARLFMVAGLISLPVLWITEGQTGWIVMATTIAIAALVPIVLSYLVWRADPERETYSADNHDET